jgi:hypothetical protein
VKPLKRKMTAHAKNDSTFYIPNPGLFFNPKDFRPARQNPDIAAKTQPPPKSHYKAFYPVRNRKEEEGSHAQRRSNFLGFGIKSDIIVALFWREYGKILFSAGWETPGVAGVKFPRGEKAIEEISGAELVRVS